MAARRRFLDGPLHASCGRREHQLARAFTTSREEKRRTGMIRLQDYAATHVRHRVKNRDSSEPSFSPRASRATDATGRTASSATAANGTATARTSR